jgi:hypothetical protein
MIVAPAITFPKILFDCQRFPALCNLVLSVPSISVSWVPSNDGQTGVVIVTGSGFTASSQVKVDISNCLGGGSPLDKIVTADPHGEFTTHGTCLCGGTTTVNAFGLTTSDTAHASAPIPC